MIVNGGRVFVERSDAMVPVSGIAISDRTLSVAIRNIARLLGDDVGGRPATRIKNTPADALVFATWSGKADFREQRAQGQRLPRVRAPGAAAGDVANVQAHVLVLGTRQGRPGKIVAQFMGHAKVDTTLNIYTQVLDGSVREATERLRPDCSRLFIARRRRGR